jgi:Fe2+ or Zn2+ uptake regulation protein
MSTSKLQAEIQAILLGYLEEHPKAEDTLSGIQEWWLLRRMGQYSPECVQRAVEQLVEAGFIQTVRLDDGRAAYGLRRGSGFEGQMHS